MIRAPRLAVSRPMYAFDPATWEPRYFHVDPHWTPPSGWEPCYREGQPTGGVVRAVWFRRKNGKTLAAMGTYSPHIYGFQITEPTTDDYQTWIEAADDNRYGGSHWSSWDGSALLTTDPPSVTPDVAAERIEFLDAMLRGFPHPPAGYDGWWTMPRPPGGRR